MGVLWCEWNLIWTFLNCQEKEVKIPKLEQAKTPKADSAKKRGRPKGSKNKTPKGDKKEASPKQNKEEKKIVMEISDDETEG